MRRSRYAPGLAIAGNVALLASLFPFTGVNAGPRLILALAFGLPLLTSLNGLCRAQVYTAARASMAALFYIAYAMVEYIAGAGTAAVDLCLAGSIAMFVGTVVFAKWDARDRGLTGKKRRPDRATSTQRTRRRPGRHCRPGRQPRLRHTLAQGTDLAIGFSHFPQPDLRKD